MVSSSSLPDRPSRRGSGLRPRRCSALAGCSSVTDTISLPSIGSATSVQDASLPRNRSNYRSLMSAGSDASQAWRAAILARKTPRNTALFAPIATVSKDRRCGIRATIDENGPLPYKPRQLSAMARFDRGGSFGPQMARFGPASITGLTSIYQSGKLPGQRRTTREADLSTQQTGAQAPSRLPRPPRDRRRPQGSRRAPRAGPQASERLSRASRRFHHGSVKAAGGLPRRCQWRAGQQRCLRACKAAAATMTARSGSASPLPKRTAPPPSATASGAGFANW